MISSIPDCDVKSILIIKIGALGDVLRTTCILPGLRAKFPQSKISWLTDNSAAPLLENNSLIDKLLFSQDAKKTNLFGALNVDLTISLDDDHNATALASQIATRKLIGAYLGKSGPTYTPDSSPWFNMGLISKLGKKEADHLKKINAKSIPQLLSQILQISTSTPVLTIPKAASDRAINFGQRHNPKKKPVIGLNTGAGPRWQFKSLSIEKTASLADQISQRLNVEIFIFGGPEERSRNTRIIHLANSHVVDTGTGNSIIEFAALLSQCSVLVSSDSLALHIANSLKIPTVVFFGPTSSAEIEVSQKGAKISPAMDCLTCYKRSCSKKPNCMDNLELEKILAAIEDALP